MTVLPLKIAHGMYKSGFDVGASYDPGSLGFHELLDRACMVAEIFGDHISTHPAADHPKLRKTITKIEKELYDLYQKIANLS